MKFFILVSSILALASASWSTIQEKYHGPLHHPKISNGVPIEPAAVQHAREAHMMALSEASKHQTYSHDNQYDKYHEAEQKQWQGPKHYPVIHEGVPVETAEVQHAREAHLEALSQASHVDNHFDQYESYDNHLKNVHGYDYKYQGIHEDGKKWNGPLHYPKINKGVPVEPVEVQHARYAHFKALSEIKQQGGDVYGQDQENHHLSNGYMYSYEQIHAPVYKNLAHQHHEIPVIGHDGMAVETTEVQQAKAAHLAAHLATKSKYF